CLIRACTECAFSKLPSSPRCALFPYTTLFRSHFENLFAPIEVNFIGINGMPVAGQTIDFDKKHHFLENDIARFVSLTKAIELEGDRKSTRLNSSHVKISYAVFCLKKKSDQILK